MQAHRITSRTAAIATSAALLALGGTIAGQAQRADGAPGGTTVQANALVKVVKAPNGAIVAESLRTGERTRLGRQVTAKLVDVDGHYVGFARRAGDSVEVGSIDARTGRFAQRRAVDNVLALEVRRTGTVVWVTQDGAKRTVHGSNAGGVHLLGQGEAIDPRSLALADSPATTAHVYWTDGREVESAAIE